MREYLLSNLADEERSFAAGLREDPSISAVDFVRTVFSEFDDPMLSIADIRELWGDGASLDAFRKAVNKLVEDRELEVSTKTQRPFDVHGIALYRDASSETKKIVVTAIESQGSTGESRYQFAMEGRLIRGLARIDRLDALAGSGNQRDEIKKHVMRISEGVKSGTQVPNPVLLVMLESSTQVFDVNQEIPNDTPESFVTIRPLEDFQEVRGRNETLIQRSRIVELSFPWRRAAFDEEKSVLLVDGQQRTAALSLIPFDHIPFIDIGVSAVLSTEENAKRVFQVSNDSVKISTDFSKALLASMEQAPGYLKGEQLTAESVRRLSLQDQDSPFYSIVRYPGAKSAGTVIAYNSLFGLVTTFRNSLPDDLVNTPEKLAEIVSDSFSAVKKTWPEAWGIKPTTSKLMHGAGLRAITEVLVDKLQSYLASGYDAGSTDIEERLESSLERLATKIAWTDAEAASGSSTQKNNWRNQISNKQNTNQDITQLSDFLTRESVSLDMKAARGK